MMRTAWSLLLAFLLLAPLAGCGRAEVEPPESPVPPPEGDPDSTSTTVPAPD